MPLDSPPPPQYAVREFGHQRTRYLLRHPETGQPVHATTLADAYCQPPATFPQAEARKVALEWSLRDPDGEWGIEVAPRPCPRCHREIFADDLDFCYPVGRDRKRWRAGCNEHDFGCGLEYTDDTAPGVMAKWNGIKPATPEPEQESTTKERVAKVRRVRLSGQPAEGIRG